MVYPKSININVYNSENNGQSEWYQQCSCCPYGYHIDLDFVRYCESIQDGVVHRTGSFKRRRDRRRQRQSMEVLLGLEPPNLGDLEQHFRKAMAAESPKAIKKGDIKLTSPFIHDALEEVVSDFERTLQRSNKLSHNLPDVTAVHETFRRVPSVSSMSSASGSSMTVLPSAADGAAGKDFDTISIESCGLSPLALQNIREQMALSLERTKELEERVKMIPTLQAQLSVLKEEKRKLLMQIKETQSTTTINGNFLSTIECSRSRSQSFTKAKTPPPPPPRRDFGIMCGVLTRNVGVGHQYPKTKSVSTATVNGGTEGDFTDKWYKEKIKFLANDAVAQSPVMVGRSTQTVLERKNIGNQTGEQIVPKSLTDTNTQTTVKRFRSYGALASVDTTSVGSETAVIAQRTLGVSEDTINDEFCSKCSSKLSLPHPAIASISLASLTVPRSRSFNLGEDQKLNLQSRSRSVGCQYEPLGLHSKACQHEQRTQTKFCQSDMKILANKLVQYESSLSSKTTDTRDLGPGGKHVACNTAATEIETAEMGCNTVQAVPEGVPTTPCPKCSSARREREDFRKDDNVPVASPSPSRIPRPQIPTTPVENRKFRRQDTYTKIPASANEASGLSSLDLSSKTTSNEAASLPFDKFKPSCQLPEDIPAQNGSSSTKVLEPSVSETSLCKPTAQDQKKKVVPSVEMQAAMKVLNDSLQKGQTKNLKTQLKNAIDIIRQEWFQISGLVAADPFTVEDYLDSFEDVSFNLLQYVVNMVDVSGNTAMHYAVSHGNFDVVSILLDSKVCDINQQNKAGYTSVMLVSLAEVRSPTHANVVRRLFQLADVNVRAKEHGQTALMLAVSHGRLDMVTMLLEAGADINIQDEDGSTALMCAAEHGHIDIVKHFLSQPDCDSSIIDVDGSTALKIAMDAGHRHIGVLLYAHERNLHGSKSTSKKTKSTSASPRNPSSPLPLRSSHRALSDCKLNK